MPTNTSITQSPRAASPHPSAGTDASDVQTRVEELLPAVHARRQEIEQARRLPRSLVDALRATGVFTLGVPRALGGREATPLELMHIIETVAAADGSTGWCTMVGIGNALAAGYMDEAGAREVFADPSAPIAGIAAPAGGAVRVDGGVRVSGRWPFASGITHSEWVWAGCLVLEGGQDHEQAGRRKRDLLDGLPATARSGRRRRHAPFHRRTAHLGGGGTGAHGAGAAGAGVLRRLAPRVASGL